MMGPMTIPETMVIIDLIEEEVERTVVEVTEDKGKGVADLKPLLPHQLKFLQCHLAPPVSVIPATASCMKG